MGVITISESRNEILLYKDEVNRTELDIVAIVLSAAYMTSGIWTVLLVICSTVFGR